jgi:hypothetical protein
MQLASYPRVDVTSVHREAGRPLDAARPGHGSGAGVGLASCLVSCLSERAGAGCRRACACALRVQICWMHPRGQRRGRLPPCLGVAPNPCLCLCLRSPGESERERLMLAVAS